MFWKELKRPVGVKGLITVINVNDVVVFKIDFLIKEYLIHMKMDFKIIGGKFEIGYDPVVIE